MRIDEFLLARIAEDEAVAREAMPSPWTRSAGRVWSGASEVSAFTGTGTLDHVARWDPARVLAECAAKRGVVEECRDAIARGESKWLAGRVVLPLLARGYADHPDYRPEWAG